MKISEKVRLTLYFTMWGGGWLKNLKYSSIHTVLLSRYYDESGMDTRALKARLQELDIIDDEKELAAKEQAQWSDDLFTDFLRQHFK